MNNISPLDATSEHAAASRLERPLRLVVLGPTERGAAMLHWRKIESSLSNRRLMCSAVWTETWLNHYGALVPHRFVIAHRNGIACGIALLTCGVDQHDGPFSISSWHVGTAGEPDADSVCVEYNSLLARDEDRVDFFRQILTWINSQLDFDQTKLDGFALDEIAPLLEGD